MRWLMFLMVVFAVAAMVAPVEAAKRGGWVDSSVSIGQNVMRVILNVATGMPAWIGVDLGWSEEYDGGSDDLGYDGGSSPPPPGQKPPNPKIKPSTTGGIKWYYANGGGRR